MNYKIKIATAIAVVIVLLSIVYKYTARDSSQTQNKKGSVTTSNLETNKTVRNSRLAKLLQEAQSMDISNEDQKNKLSSEIADELLLIYTSSKKIKDFNKEKALKDLAEEVLNSTPNNKYNKADLNIKEGVDLMQYNEEIKKALEPLYELNEYELELIAKTYNDFDDKNFKKIKNYHDRYQEAVDNLKEVPVAPEFAQMHLSLLNAYERIRLALLLIYFSKNDTILAYPGLSAYLKAENDLMNVQRFVNNYIKSHVKEEK